MIGFFTNETPSMLHDVFKKQFFLCDDFLSFLTLQANTARVVFSWNPNDPADKDSPTYHGTERRGSTSLNLLGGLVDPPELPDDLDSFSIRVSNVRLACSI